MAANPNFTSHVSENTFEVSPWKITVRKSHILQSRCTNEAVCQSISQENFESRNQLCDFCFFERELELPQLPEMTFASNVLKIEHSKEFGLKFDALDALKLVDSKHDLMKVAVAEHWQESRTDNSNVKDVVKPFDWTYSTHYKGTFFGNADNFKILPTDERIDIEKLKVKSKILFYDEVMLFEDELADNGTAQCSVKIRVMPDCFLVLLRYFLRIDDLLVRIIDTRIHYEVGNNYMLLEHVTKESKIKDLIVEPMLLRNPQELWNHLPTLKSEYEKIEF